MKIAGAQWMAAPFIRLVIPFVTGLAMAEYLPQLKQADYLFLIICLFCFCLLCHYLVSRQFKSAHIQFGVAIHLLLACTGGIHYQLQDIRNQANWFGHTIDNHLLYAAEPESLPALGKKSARFIFSIRTVVKKDGSIAGLKGKLLLYLPLEQSNALQPGRLYLLPATQLKPLVFAGNPGSFDFADYNQKKNICHQAFLDTTKLVAYPDEFDNHYRVWLTEAQRTAFRAMDRAIESPHNQLAKALLIGYREEVDKETLDVYSQTGVVHVIAVSGMHLGLIFMLLQRLLIFPEHRFRITRWIKFLLILLVTWFFTVVAGSAGSIIRAAFMFSFMLFAKLLRKQVSTMQSIAITALILLLVDPYWLWDAGFLLSFSALLSIVLYQPTWVSMIRVKNPMLRAVWELVAVTMAAQMLTIPLCIALFHQMPVYFLPANLLAVPLSSLALIGTLLLWVCDTLNMSLPMLGQITGELINWMNLGIGHISQLPYALITEIEWSGTQLLLAYLFLIVLGRWLLKPTRISFIWAAMLVTGFSMNALFIRWQQENQEELLIYHLPGKSMITYIQGRTASYYLNRYAHPAHPALAAAHRVAGIKQVRYSNQTLFYRGEQLISIPSDEAELSQLIRLNPCLMLITRQIRSIAELPAQTRQKTLLVLDGSIPEDRAISWYRELKEKGYEVYSTWHSGAFYLPVSTVLPIQDPEK